MTRIIKAGIIGCGRVAQWHSKFLKKKIKSIKILSVCDIDLISAKKTAKIYNSKYCLNYIDILNDKDIELVFINTESGKHYKHSKDSLLAGKHVIVEKPPAMFPNEFKNLIDIARKNKLLFVPIFQNRFNPTINKLKEIVDKGRLGKIVNVSVNLLWCRYQSYYEDGWHGKWKMDGGVINQQAIHHIDALNWIFGPVIELASLNAKRVNKLEAEDTNIAIAKLKNGILATITATTAVRPEDLDASIRVIGENGYITLGGIALNKFTEMKIINKFFNKKSIFKLNYEVENGYGYSHELVFKKSADSILNKSLVSPIEYKSVLETLQLIHSIYRSSEDKKFISLKNNRLSRKLGK